MQALGDEGALGDCSTSGCACPNVQDDDDDDLDSDNWDNDNDTGGREHNSDSSGDEVDDSLSLVLQLELFKSFVC